jgi:hypothetical protein
MSKTAQTLHNPLILLALGAVSIAWADDAHTLAAPVQRAVTAPAPVHPAVTAAPVRLATAAPVHRRLDLTPPDIRDVMSADELNVPLASPDEEFAGPETVQVKGAPPALYVPGGFEALWWGAIHPTQAWRVLAPVQ